MGSRASAAGALAGTDSGERGLPRGRSSLAPAETSALQRERLVKAAIATVAERGYAGATVKEIARAARVSLRTFYEHFEGREDCVLTAVDEAVKAVGSQVENVLAAIPPNAPPITRLRSAFAANLAAWSAEPELAIVLHLELRAAGPAGRERYFAILGGFARFCRSWHREVDPKGAAATPRVVYRMAMGGLEQLVTEHVHAGRITELTELTDPALRATIATISEWSGPELPERIGA